MDEDPLHTCLVPWRHPESSFQQQKELGHFNKRVWLSRCMTSSDNIHYTYMYPVFTWKSLLRVNFLGIVNLRANILSRKKKKKISNNACSLHTTSCFFLELVYQKIMNQEGLKYWTWNCFHNKIYSTYFL